MWKKRVDGHPNYPQGVLDNTHLNEQGADAFAELVVEDIKRQQLPIVNDLK